LCGRLVVRCVCWRRDGALVGNSVCDAGAPACGGRWIVACGVCSWMYAALLRLHVCWAISRGRACVLRGRRGCEAGCAVAAVRTRGCGWGSAGQGALGGGWRMRGADARTESGGGRRLRVCSCAAWDGTSARAAARAWGLCEIGVVWVEGCGFIGMADVVGRGIAAAGTGGSAAAWAERCGWIGCMIGVWVCVAGWWCGACAGGGTGLGSATWRAMRARRRAAAVGPWLLVCAARTRPVSDFQFCWAMSRGRACLLRGRGDARRDAPWLP
jgi:hypothetical protein